MRVGAIAFLRVKAVLAFRVVCRGERGERTALIALVLYAGLPLLTVNSGRPASAISRSNISLSCLRERRESRFFMDARPPIQVPDFVPQD